MKIYRLKVWQGGILFILILLAIYYYVGIIEALYKRPMSVHLWAMCDRGSVARNYEQFSMNFFQPRVHFTREGEGITGLEFPLMNYMAAICYKLFGFSEFWYRFVMLVTVSMGLFAAWRISFRFLPFIVSLIPPLLLLACPILTYYAANFLPDAGAFGFMLLGWLVYFRAKGKYSRSDLWMLTLFFSLATLIKLTAVISIVVILVIAIAGRFTKNESLPPWEESKKLFLPAFIILLVTIGWYKYAGWLSHINESEVFLMQSMTPRSLDYIKVIFEEIDRVWLQFYYTYSIRLYIVLSFFILPFVYKKLNRHLFLITYGYWAGNFFFFYMMMEQFVHHDYYVIILLPAVFFQTLLLLDGLSRIPYIKYAAFAFGLILIPGFQFDREHQEFRYSDGCWLYDWSKFRDYMDVEPYVQSLGLKPSDKVISVCDDSPNIPLYLLNLRGWRLHPRKGEEELKAILKYKPEYCVSCDTARIHEPMFENRLIKIGEKGRIEFYRIRY